MQDWDLKPRSEVCHKCLAPFADKQPYFSAVSPGEDGFLRVDYCSNCRPPAEKGNAQYSAWRGTYHAPPAATEEPLKKENAESLLRKLMDEEDATKLNVIFVLAVMLERKKILVEKDVQKHENGSLLRIYEHKLTGETFMIREPALRLDQLEHVQTEVITMLGGTPPKSAVHSAATASTDKPSVEK
jgi:hypothetical protein